MPLQPTRTALRRKLADLSTRRFQSSGHRRPDPSAHATKTTEQASPAPATAAAQSPSLWQRLGPLGRLAEAYSRANKRRPWVTQVAGSLVIFGLADLNAQRIGGNEYDPIRTRNMLITGAVFSIPAYEWFKRLGTMFTFPSFPLSIAVRVLFNQFTFAPMINTYFFSMQALLTGANVWERVCEKVPITWLNSWKLWPGIIAFNLAFVPHHFRGLVAGFASVGWQTYLSIQNKKAELMEEAKRNHTEAPEAPTLENAGALAQAA